MNLRKWHKVCIGVVAFLLILVIGALALIHSYALSVNKAQCFIEIRSAYLTEGLSEEKLRERIDEVLDPKLDSYPLRCDDLGFREVQFNYKDGVAEGTYRLDDRTETYSSSR